jgi:hypothetical protein
VPGSATYQQGKYRISAAGSDIWSAADQFHFVYQPVTGDVDIVARVVSITNTDAWAKGGVMIRESLTAESRHAFMLGSMAKGYAFQRRVEPGGLSSSTPGGTGALPGWVRLVRRGDVFEAYRSTNGSRWTKVASDTIAMAEAVYVGLAVTSHNPKTATTAEVDGLKITSASPTAKPVVSITSPATGTRVRVGATVEVTALAADPENQLVSVEFYAGSALLTRDSAAPHQTRWTPAASGTYVLTAVAHTADGRSGMSGPVNVTVESANRPPTVTVSAGAGPFVAPATVTLTALAADPEGQLARVEFFSGSTRLGSDTTAPYSLSWSGVPQGIHPIMSVAYDQAGASTSSAVSTVTVVAAPRPPPPPPGGRGTRTVVFTASADHAQVIGYLLEVFAAGANAATAVPIAVSDLGKPSPGAANTIALDRTAFLTALPPGTYIATVTAVGAGGRSRSAAVTFSP